MMSSPASHQQPHRGANGAASLLADPVAEARRLVGQADQAGLVVRALGGTAVCLQAPGGRPLLPRPVGDIDLVTPRGGNRAIASLLEADGYVGDEMFNALHAAHRQVYFDPTNDRKLDAFVGHFSMCHVIPISARLDHDPLTIPLAELLLTKLQIVQLTERDQRDIYNLCFHHELDGAGGSGIESALVADLCARDWGLWRTSKGTIERCDADLAHSELAADQRQTISERLQRLWERVQAAPKTQRWRLRNRVGDRVRWYEEPEEESAAV
jgi:hypothetical protein